MINMPALEPMLYFCITGVKSDDPLPPNYVPSMLSFIKMSEKKRKQIMLKAAETRKRRSPPSGKKQAYSC